MVEGPGTHPEFSSTRAVAGEGWRSACGGIALLLAVLLLAACTSGGSKQASQAGSVGEGAGPVALKVMEFNIEYGGEGISFRSVIDAVELADPDVVGIEEPYGNIPKLAESLGWKYFDPQRQFLSKYPLIAPPDASPYYTYVEVSPRKVVAMADVHLTSSQYGPNIIVHKGADLKEVLAVENRTRLPEIEPVIDAMSGNYRAQVPSFILGDFNAPSHLDWTEAMVGTSPQMKFAVEWPVSKALEAAGFIDSYRAVYPDPATDLGFTWPAMRPKIPGEWNPSRDSLDGRIDQIYSAGPAKATGSYLIGEKGADVAETVTPWPTDHRAIVSTFEVTPAPMPPPEPFVAADPQLVTTGKPLTVTFYAPGSDASVAIVPEGGDASAAVAEQLATDATPVEGNAPVVSMTFDTSGWKPEAHDVLLVDASGAELARAPIWVRTPGEKVQVETNKNSYKVGEPIEVTWYAAPANRWDWVGIYERGADPHDYMLWAYTQGTVAGEVTLSGPSPGLWPLDPGKYGVYFLLNDGYSKAGQKDFTVHA